MGRKPEFKLCLSPFLMGVACILPEPQFPALENGDSHKPRSSPGTEARVEVSLADPGLRVSLPWGLPWPESPATCGLFSSSSAESVSAYLGSGTPGVRAQP